MKLLVTFFLLFSISAYGQQTITAQELVDATKCGKLQCIAKAATAKGYTGRSDDPYDDSDDNEFLEPNASKCYENYVTYLGGFAVLDVVIADDTRYNTLAAEFKKLGFKMVEVGKVGSTSSIAQGVVMDVAATKQADKCGKERIVYSLKMGSAK